MRPPDSECGPDDKPGQACRHDYMHRIVMYDVAGLLADLLITILRLLPPFLGAPDCGLSQFSGARLSQEGYNTAGQVSDLPRALLEIVLHGGRFQHVDFFTHVGLARRFTPLNKMRGAGRVFSSDWNEKENCCSVRKQKAEAEKTRAAESSAG